MPFLHHVATAVDQFPRPGNLRSAALREDIIRPLRWPPGQFAFLRAIVKVCLPGDRHLLGDVARLEVGGIQTKRLGICVAVAHEPTRFDARIESAPDTGLESGAV